MKFSKTQTSMEPTKTQNLENTRKSASEYELQALLNDSSHSSIFPPSFCDSKGPDTSTSNLQKVAPIAQPESSLESIPNVVSSNIDVRSDSRKSSDVDVNVGTHQSNPYGIRRDRVQSISSTESVMFCRICHQGEVDEALIQLCHCSGTMGLVHKSCIEKWLGTIGSDKCEICNFGFKTERVTKPFSEWLLGQSTMKDRQNLVADMSCFIVLTPLAGVSTWLCVTGAQHYYNDAAHEYNWETWGLTALTVFLIMIYLIWCSVAFRYHRRVYYTWRHRNQFVRVLDSSFHKENASETTLIEIDMNNNSVTSTPSQPAELAAPQTSDTTVSKEPGYVCERCAKTTRPNKLSTV